MSRAALVGVRWLALTRQVFLFLFLREEKEDTYFVCEPTVRSPWLDTQSV